MGIEVRPARPDELARVNELRRQVNDLHVQGRPDIFRPGFSADLERHLVDAFGENPANVIVALLDGEIAGFASLQDIQKPESPYSLARSFLRMEEFGVDEGCRRRGVATALVDYLRREARRRGYDRIELDVWAFNEGALAFYEAAGFNCYRRYMELDLD